MARVYPSDCEGVKHFARQDKGLHRMSNYSVDPRQPFWWRARARERRDAPRLCGSPPMGPARKRPHRGRPWCDLVPASSGLAPYSGKARSRYISTRPPGLPSWLNHFA